MHRGCTSGNNLIRYDLFEVLVNPNQGPTPTHESYFIDRSVDIMNFTNDIESRDLMPLLNQLNPKEGKTPTILPDVLCP